MSELPKSELQEYEFYLDATPPGWVITSLSCVATKITDGTHKTPNYQPSGVRFISIKNIRPYQPINWETYEKYISQSEHEELTRRCDPEKNDILFPRIGTLGFAKRIDFDEPVSIFVGLGLIKPNRNTIEPKFLEHYMNSSYVDRLSRKRANGTGRKTLPLEETRRFPIPLPPLNEQRRIVEKIENLFAELDKGEESLRVAKAQAGLHRQSLLKYAFEGHLTADWRAANPDKLEDPETLLISIQNERDARYKQALNDWKEALKKWRDEGEEGKKPAKPKQPSALSKLACTQNASNNRLILELGDIISVSSGMGLTSAQMNGGDHAVYGGNGINGFHDDFFVAEPTLIIGRVGAKCGVTHITRPESWVTDNALIVTPLIYSFDQTYFKHLLLFLNLNALGSSTGQPVISGAKIYPVEIHLPTHAEQIEIVNHLEAKLSTLDALEHDLDTQLTHSTALRQSILKRAFSGQLVPQDTSDESASKLLERIKAEKAETAKKVRSAGPKQRGGKPKPRRITMADLIAVLKDEKDWVSAEVAARRLGIADGATSDAVEDFYRDLRAQLENGKVEVERRGDADWLRLAPEKVA